MVKEGGGEAGEAAEGRWGGEEGRDRGRALLFSGKNYWVRPEKTEKKFSLAKNTLSPQVLV